MTQYCVRWEIELEADSPMDAAQEALRIHRDPESIATIFEVRDMDTRVQYAIDVLEGTITTHTPGRRAPP
jgi:hypothetical protein